MTSTKTYRLLYSCALVVTLLYLFSGRSKHDVVVDRHVVPLPDKFIDPQESTDEVTSAPTTSSPSSSPASSSLAPSQQSSSLAHSQSPWSSLASSPPPPPSVEPTTRQQLQTETTTGQKTSDSSSLTPEKALKGEVTEDEPDQSMEPKTLTLWPEEGHCKDLDFLVVIQIRFDDFNKREMLRRLYSPYKKKYNFDFFFTLGQSNSSVNQKWLARESDLHKDILQGDFMDTYKNLTHKQLMQMRYIVANCSSTLPTIVKIDDDVVVNLKVVYNISQTVKAENEKTREQNKNFKGENEIRGYVFTKMPILRHIGSPWAIPRSRLPGQYYQHYCSGTAYMWTIEAITNILNQVKTARWFYIDDVFISGMLAKKANVTLVQMKDSIYVDKARLRKEVVKNEGQTFWWTHTDPYEKVFKMLHALY